MGQKKGHSGNLKGRPRGTANKITIELKSWVTNLINQNRQTLELDLSLMEPRERWQIIERLMQFVIPKMASVEAKLELDKLSDEQLDEIINSISKKVK